MTLILTPLQGIPLIQPGDDLAGVILSALEESAITLRDNDIFVLAQKIVSKAEGRLVNLPTVKPSPQALIYAEETEKDSRLVELILQESEEILRARPGLMIVVHRLGFVSANAGIDHSNVKTPETWKVSEDLSVPGSDEWVLLLPENPDQSAASIREKLQQATRKKLGVMIIDSHGRAWRNGTVGVCIGLSGLPGLIDMRGQKDLFGYELRATEVGVADELAAAASLVMGQVAEGTPVVHVHGFPYALRDASLQELLRPKEKDLFR
jgi:coenzyme F420-0:L-glutamate ligase/coenzyme F420-1:gamma-L-glutamate ligase